MNATTFSNRALIKTRLDALYELVYNLEDEFIHVSELYGVYDTTLNVEDRFHIFLNSMQVEILRLEGLDDE